jgi:hypothetical protein
LRGGQGGAGEKKGGGKKNTLHFSGPKRGAVMCAASWD